MGTRLRERMHQHFDGGEGTGSLVILRTGLIDLDRWRISYVTIVGRIAVAKLIDERGRGWIFYSGLLYTSPIWIELAALLILGKH